MIKNTSVPISAPAALTASKYASLPDFYAAITVTGKDPSQDDKAFRVFPPKSIPCLGLAPKLTEFTEALVASLNSRFAKHASIYRTLEAADSAQKQGRTGLLVQTKEKYRFWANCEVLVSGRGPDLFIVSRRYVKLLRPRSFWVYWAIVPLLSCFFFLLLITADPRMAVAVGLLILYTAADVGPKISSGILAEPASMEIETGIELCIDEVETKFSGKRQRR